MTKQEFINSLRSNPYFLLDFAVNNNGEAISQNLIGAGYLTPETAPKHTADLYNLLVSYLQNGQSNVVLAALSNVPYNPSATGRVNQIWVKEGLSLGSGNYQGVAGDGTWWVNFGNGVGTILSSILGTNSGPAQQPDIIIPAQNNTPIYLMMLLMFAALVFFYFQSKK